MDKLSQFYIELSTNVEKMTMFNCGSNDLEISQNRQKMLQASGIDDSEEIIKMSQQQLQRTIERNLGEQSDKWANLTSQVPNSGDNKLSNIGLKRAH